ncbi:gliding motility-associated C-terminal domain-containing protein [Flavobacterium amniphilum]|uniref:gliding motility-associated C-terminal domain-containing protein n=1 Tax=Flavobacterium amniphilum TaxID=1834035 RepID=UPI00202AAD0D|nr:gliding motility-associated C-terminal domain-containing protein [Flavobacterium amniphilum]MCL9807503.1 gliding motility-associated C-terminal domain-containing protein [Flavobacterium amniphilum]
MGKIYFFFIILWVNVCSSQGLNFSLNVTAVNETCPGNGRLNFTVSNAAADGTVIFTVYKLPDVTTPIVTTQANTFTGLVAANYRVVATESLPNGTINTRQRDVLILDRIAQMQLNFQKVNQTCTHLGSITIATISGYPESYEIISGPITFAPQPSNVFNDLVNGNYTVKVVDGCGEFIIQNVTIENSRALLAFGENRLSLMNCNFLSDSVLVTAQDEIYYPVTVQYTVYQPNGTTTVSSQVINSGDPESLSLIRIVPFQNGQIYRYRIALTDACGNIFNSGEISYNPSMKVFAEINLVACTKKRVELNINAFGIPPFTVNFLSSPPGFNPVLFNNSHPTFNSDVISYYSSSVDLPTGSYNVQITDSCGKTDNVVFTIDNVLPAPTIIVSQLKGCGEGFSSLSMVANSSLYQITSAELVAAPVSYVTSLPVNLNSNIYQGELIMENLPSGEYRFKITDRCGNIHNVSAQAVGYYTISNNVNVIEDCASFKIDLLNISNVTQGLASFWLQKFDPATNKWVHPVTGMSSNDDVNSLNAISLNNNAISNAVSITGKFRVMKKFYSYKLPTPSNTSTTNYCFEEIKSFDFNLEPRINNIYSFSCSNNSYQVIVEAGGAAPFRYEIVAKNGQPFYIDNANSSVFNGLSAGVYSFKVTDNCNNIKNRLFEVSGNVILPVMATQFCNGSTANLSVPYFSYLHYEWWKGNNTSQILSTLNTLAFSPFNFNTDAGIYHVRITNPGNPNTCINFVLDYTIQNSLNNPVAGNDSETTICGAHSIIDLNLLLSANHDSNGMWSEISNSGVSLINGVWDSTNVAAGAYTFQYKVDGLCDRDDLAVIKINLKNQPQSPNAFSDSHVCMLGELHLYASTVFGATYVWTGPNGFTSNDQNPVLYNVNSLMQGTYTVKAILDGCESVPSSVVVAINDFPDFQLKTWCEGNKMIKVDFVNQNANQNLYSYDWVYPDGSIHPGTQSIEVVNGQTGNYSVVVTDFNGCDVQKTIEINCTFCNIPKGVSANGDNANDSFDLSCIDDIRNVKIFNRYGVLIFEKDNYINEWKGYDKNDRLLPVGTYYYLIAFYNGEPKSGWVYLNY